MLSEFGGMMAQGAAWGMGSSLGHRMMGGLFGGGGGGAARGGDVAGPGAAPTNFGTGDGEFDDMDDGGGGGDGGGLFDFFSED